MLNAMIQTGRRQHNRRPEQILRPRRPLQHPGFLHHHRRLQVPAGPQHRGGERKGRRDAEADQLRGPRVPVRVRVPCEPEVQGRWSRDAPDGREPGRRGRPNTEVETQARHRRIPEEDRRSTALQLLRERHGPPRTGGGLVLPHGPRGYMDDVEKHVGIDEMVVCARVLALTGAEVCCSVQEGI